MDTLICIQFVLPFNLTPIFRKKSNFQVLYANINKDRCQTMPVGRDRVGA